MGTSVMDEHGDGVEGGKVMITFVNRGTTSIIRSAASEGSFLRIFAAFDKATHQTSTKKRSRYESTAMSVPARKQTVRCS